MKTVYLHIGYNKTGTTAIQKTFFKNVKLLEKNNLFYPLECRGERESPAHHSLAESLLFACNKPLPTFVNSGIYAKYSFDHYWKLLHQELAKTKCSGIFISSEAFSRFRQCESQIRFIKEQFGNYKVKILVYIREPIAYFESAYNQAIKSGNETRTIKKMLNQGWLTLDYFEEIEKWAMVFGDENIIVRVYDKSNFANGIAADVLEATGFGNSIDFKNLPMLSQSQNKDYNPRLPDNMVEIKRKINIIFRLKPKKSLKCDYRINYFLTRLAPFFKVKSLLSDDEKKFLYDHFYESNIKLGKKYLGGTYPFKTQNPPKTSSL
jgi:hypothetical protein